MTRWLPASSHEVTFQRAESGGSTPVYRVEWNHERFFLRLGEAPSESREAEVRVHLQLHASGIPVPEVVAWESSPRELDRAATLTRAVPGMALIDALAAGPVTNDDLGRVLRAAGRDLARINQLPMRGFGWGDAVDPDDGSLIAEHQSRRDWTHEHIEAATEIFSSDLLDAATARHLERDIDAWINLPDGEMSWLAHGDFDPTHIFVTNDATGRCTYTGIIDFGEIRGADLFYDLGHVHLQDAQLHEQPHEQPGQVPILPDLLRGYGEVTPLPDGVMRMIHLQAMAIGIRQLAIFRRRDSPWTMSLARQVEALVTQGEDDE